LHGTYESYGQTLYMFLTIKYHYPEFEVIKNTVSLMNIYPSKRL
jgi:hypothetical protein